MFSAAQIDEYRSLNASAACSTCQHVWSEGAAIRAVARIKPHFLVGCCEECLEPEDHIVVRAEHLYDITPDFLPLLHIPKFGKAVREGKTWRLGILDVPADISAFEGNFFIQRHLDDFFAQAKTMSCLFVGKNLHFETLHRGARVVPIWTTEAAAIQYKRSLPFLFRLLLRVKSISATQLQELCHLDRHNYLALNHSSTMREALVIDRNLNIEENTMQL